MCILLAVCNCAVHKKCHDRVLGKCPGSAKESRETKVIEGIQLYTCVSHTHTVIYYALRFFHTGSGVCTAVRHRAVPDPSGVKEYLC